MDKIDKARKYLVDFMNQRFGDKGFGCYIRRELAGDFAYQLSTALQKITSDNTGNHKIADKIEVFYSTRSNLSREDVHYLEALCRQLRVDA